MNKKDKAKIRKRFELQAEVLKALAHPARLMMVHALREGELCVCELAEIAQTERTSVSKHLALLKNAGILRDRKEGLKVYYSLARPCVLNFFECVENVVKSRVQEERSALS